MLCNEFFLSNMTSPTQWHLIIVPALEKVSLWQH